MRALPRFSVENGVVANLIMLAVIGGGLYAAATLIREMFPEIQPTRVAITALYPGATPIEVERGVAMRVEEAIKDIRDVEKVRTTIGEGFCSIVIELTNDADDIDTKVNEFKAAIDAIPRDELPEESEEIRVTKFEPRLPVISVALFGDLPEATLKAAGLRLRDDLLALPGITDVELSGTRKAELTVEVRPEDLVKYRLSLSQVADAIRAANLDLPGGTVKGAQQNVAVRTLGETDQAAAIEQTILRTTPSGRILRVADVGRVIDAFEDADIRGRFNGKPTVDVTVYKTGDQDAIDIASKVKAFVAGKAGQPLERDWATWVKNLLGFETAAQQVYARSANDPYPPGLQALTHSNLARFIEGRLELLTRNGIWGIFFVYLSLLIFMHWRVAFWVMMGVVFAVCGTAIVMQAMGISLNLITMFGLIVVMGMLVDDAIVVSENIYSRYEAGEDARTAAVAGAQEVTWPVIVAVTTTIGSFLPLMFIEGQIGDFMGVLPIIVAAALSLSLFEALTILPNHLAHALPHIRRGEAHGVGWFARLRRLETGFVIGPLQWLYARALHAALDYRYVTISVVLAGLILAGGLVISGRVPFVFVQKMDSETVLVNLEMPVGSPAERTEAALRTIENAVLALKDRGEVKSVWTIIGAQVSADEGGATLSQRSHIGQAIIELTEIEQRDRTSEEIIADLRRQTADIPLVTLLKFRPMQGGPAGAEIEIEVTGDEMPAVVAAAGALKARLAQKQGVYDIADDYEEGRRELQVELLDSARPLGITTRWLATEVRGAFYGLEARTIQRDREDVDIRVRFPEERRRHVYELEAMRIVTPAGAAVPLSEVARVREGTGPASVRRIDQRRSVVVSADVDQAQTNAELVLADLQPLVADLEQANPGLRVDFAGNKRETRKAFASLGRDFVIALALIYAMLAALFRSYTQPLIVMSAVPFGLNGAIAGHYWMDYPLTILSMIGIVALTGIVVNDSIVMVDFINHELRRGARIGEAVRAAAVRRLRPVLLTSITTILGLGPLMMETSFQARFLIPMAVSITFGLLFSTVLTLLVVPAIYLVIDDVQAAARWVWTGRRDAPAAAPQTG